MTRRNPGITGNQPGVGYDRVKMMDCKRENGSTDDALRAAFLQWCGPRARSVGAGHHFLPRFYLQGFTDPDPPRGHEPFLWVHRFGEPGWKKKSPKNLARKAGFYWVTTKWGETHDLLERALSLIESSVAPIIKDRIPACRPFTEADRQHFAGFVLHMGARTPAAFDRAASLYKLIYTARFKTQVEGWKHDPESWKKFKAEFNAARPESALSDDLQPEYFDKLFEPGRFRIEVNSQEMAALALSTSWGGFPFLMEMGWAFFRSEAPLYFATSDDPCAHVDPEKLEPFPSGLALPGAQISLALSRTHAFVGGWGWNGITWRLATRDLVAEINRRTALFAKHFIAAPKPGFPASEEIVTSREADPPSKAT
jgi:hypothetical protein